MAGFRGIVFDLDGTLLDTVPDSHAALSRVFGEAGLQPLSLSEVLGIVGDGARAMLRRALDKASRPIHDEKTLDGWVERYMAAYLADPIAHTVIYPRVHETLTRLRLTGAILGICTNKPRATTEVVLSKLGMAADFSAIVCPEDVERRKPDACHVMATLSRMGTTVGESVLVGDSETDVMAAVNAGIPAVAVSYGYSHAALETLPVAAIIDRMDDLPMTLARLAGQRGLT
jgi:phosphoglycolate phosphatase